MKTISYIFLVALGLLAATSVPAADPLTIVTLKLLPYGYTEKGQPAGLNFDLGNAIAREAGLTPDNRIAPLARGMEDVASGKADMIIMIPTPEIEAHAVNVGEILPTETVILGRAGTVLRSLRDVRGKTVATVRGACYDDRISRKNGIILYPTDGYAQSLKMLLAGRVDLVVGPGIGLSAAAKAMKIPAKALCEPLTLSTARGCVFVSHRTSDAIAQRITKAVKRVKENGTLQKILDKYAL